MKSVLVALVLLLSSVSLGCDYYKQQTGYLVTRAESFETHYEPCAFESLEPSCDKEELRFTLVHKDTTIIARCQAWDAKNACGELRVGQAYQCTRRDPSLMLSCGENEKATLKIERESKN